MTKRRRDFDVALRFMFQRYKDEQARLLPSERVTWAVWMRRAGILTPNQLASIRKYETTRSSDIEPHEEDD